ncbi:MAG: family 10 glycosylhydrolase [Muribaculaceae bacterium]|nr:family 10 glycosylhydrolase [Muribaculaceae bacterium]
MKFRILSAFLATMLPFMGFSAEAPQKREMRSAWVATVWQLDWPQTTISSTGNTNQISSQQDQMTKMLDSLSVNNFNAINFQIRSRSDAMYKSSYEPWSSDLVSTRGMDPGWDPLEWVVAECHKRGLECHAWINPYRFESVVGQWNGTPNNYRDTHPEWLLDVGGASILNPGLPEVTQRICDIIKEVVTNYDVDGVLFDDYFYLSGTKDTDDGDLYNAYKEQGGTMTIYDWRRDNVNRMIAAVNQTIKETKPWVRFGVSPAGIACTSSTVAKKYGIVPCPTGSDWQYNDIYSDPIAWISEQSLDFISPQIYWTTQASTNYTKATEWWSMVANKWNRHLYVSHSISSLTGASKAPAMTGMESSLAGMAQPLASGTGGETFAEYAQEVMVNREYTLNDAPGSIFYSAKYLYRTAPKFAHYLMNTVFNTKALVPAITWQKAPEQGLVQNVSRSGSKLTWDGVDNVRYTVYAFPESMPLQNFAREADYLIGVTYEPEFDIPASVLAGKQYAVCILDRYGNEYSPALAGVPAGQLDAPEAISPVDGMSIEAPFEFSWTAVEGAGEYIVEIATDAEMNNRVDQRSTTATSISTEAFHQLPINCTLYWRVRSCGAGNADGISPIYSFVMTNMLITSPSTNSVNVELNPVFVSSIADRDAELFIATDESFEDKYIIYNATGKGTFELPARTLFAGTVYYARMKYMRGETEMITPAITFTTVELDPVVPAIAKPLDGATLHCDEFITLDDIHGASALRLEVSASATFPARSSYITNNVDVHTLEAPVNAGGIKIGTALLKDGTTYYARARSSYNKVGVATAQNSDFGPTVSFVYSEQPSGVNSVIAAEGKLSVNGNIVTVLCDGLTDLTVYDIAGSQLGVLAKAPAAGQSFELPFTSGVYIVKAACGNSTLAVKAAVK